MKYFSIHKFFVVCMLLFMLKPLTTIYERKNVYFNNNYWENYSSYKFSYENSQYVKKKNPQIIPDEVFESYAGGAFLKGLNPILITHDHPPLGRYIVSLSIFLFQNESLIVIPFFVFSFIGIYLIARRCIGSNILAMVPIVILLNESLFLGKLRFTPLPEIFQFTFIVFSVYFFMKGISSKKPILNFILTSIFLGGVIATRVFALGGVLVFSFMVVLIIFERKKIIPFLLTLPLSLIVLIVSYFRTILLGASVIDVFGIQKYILAYHKSKFILPFSFWDLLLFNRWHTWWDGNKIISDTNWTIFWPVGLFSAIYLIVKNLFKKLEITKYEWVLIFWLGFYMLFLSMGYTSSRYFMPILPFLYILCVSLVYKKLPYKKSS